MKLRTPTLPIDEKSLTLNTDSYKSSMWGQYKEGTEYVFSYIESRGGAYDETVVAGVLPVVKEYLSRPVTAEEVEYAKAFWAAHGEPFPYDGWMHIVKEHGGYIPVEIRAVEEGTVVPVKNVLLTICNTDPKVPFITTWVETLLLRGVWYMTTVATQSYDIKKLILAYLVKSGDPLTISFKLHDFGARGVSSFESAGLGGMAHLINFMGTDTMTANLFAMKYYGATGPVGFSIPASEHSTITSWGRDNEIDAYRNMIEKFKGGLVACVSDSYNIYMACVMWNTMAEKIKADGTTLVVRPDSGDPVEVVPRILRILEEGFGSTINSKGYKILNNVRVIWGDGINYQSISALLRVVVDIMGYSADMLAFGMGGALLQKVDRDTQKFAMKCSAAGIRNQETGELEWVEVFKDPVTDSGKASKKGVITLYRDKDGSFRTGVSDWMPDALVTYYKNGELLFDMTFDQVRKNAEIKF